MIIWSVPGTSPDPDPQIDDLDENAGKMRESTLKRFLRQPNFAEQMELHRLDVLSSNGQLDNYEFVRRKLDELPSEQLKLRRYCAGTI